MKKSILTMTIIFILFLSLSLIMAGCGKSTVLGKEISNNTIVKINDINSDKEGYSGKTVKIEGKIMEICPTGCWFNVNDGTGVIHINLAGKDYVMEGGNLNSEVMVEGKVKYNDTGISMIGSGIEIK